MPTARRSLRLILEPGIEHQIEQLSKREGRSLAGICNRLLSEALSARRGASAEIARLVESIKAPAS